MPHQCVRCNTMFPDGAKEILQGCSCGARLFFYIKKKQVEAHKRSLNTYRSDDISLNQFLAFIEEAYDDLDIREINKKHILLCGVRPIRFI